MSLKDFFRTRKWKNPDGLDPGRMKAVMDEFARLGEVNKSIALQVSRYVIDNEDADVLLSVGGLGGDGAKEVRLACAPNAGGTSLIRAALRDRAAILRDGTDAPPDFFMRIGNVYSTLARAAGFSTQPTPEWPEWLACLVKEMCGISDVDAKYDGKKFLWQLDRFEQLLQEFGQPGDLLVRPYLDAEVNRSLVFQSFYYGPTSGLCFAGWKPYLARHTGLVREVLMGLDRKDQLDSLERLLRIKFDFSDFIDVLVEMGTGKAKTVRAAVFPMLESSKAAARPLVEERLCAGDASQRNEAAALLAHLFGSDVADLLRTHAETESSKRVRQTIESSLALAVGVEAAVAADGTQTDAPAAVELTVPPLDVETGVVELGEEAKAGLRAVLERGFEILHTNHKRAVEQYNAPDRPAWMRAPKKPDTLTDKQFRKLVQYVEGNSEKFRCTPDLRQAAWQTGLNDDALAPPHVALIHIVRLARAMEFFHDRREYGLWWVRADMIEAYRSRCGSNPFGLRELDAVIGSLPKLQPGSVLRFWLSSNSRWNSFFEWEPDAIWPAFVERLDDLRANLGPSPNRGRNYRSYDYGYDDRKRNSYRVLAMLPSLPPQVVPLLWDVALGESKTERPLAQQALGAVADKLPRIIAALDDGKQGVRFGAAEWLGKLGDAAAIEPLKKRFRKEKQEIVKGELMSALEKLGADVNEFLDRDQLLTEAEKGLAKKHPKGSEWVPLDGLPAVHWQDTGEAVAVPIVQWWIVQSIKQKSPACGALLRRYLRMCREDDASALAGFVLSSWIGQDTKPLSHDEVVRRAQNQTDQQWSWYDKHEASKKWLDELYGGKKENLYKELFRQISNECTGSAIGQKGMLAIVSAVGDRDCAKVCEQFIRKWYGQRLAQCKALLEVLTWIDDPTAIQVLLSIANRFRTKSIRKAAEDYVSELADRQGWTLDELADRTIPDGGFERPTDEDGRPLGDDAKLILDYGPRTFTVRLDDDLKPVITRDDGKTVKNPPAPAKNDDEELAKAAKKSFSAAKKVVKEVVARQSERLYESLCTQRLWTFEDWQRYLAFHPIVGRLCTRLVWSAFEERVVHQPDSDATQGWIGCFRPLEDGSLTNESDEEVTFDSPVRVRLAHTCNTPEAAAQKWLQHLEDYDVQSLFQQFGRETWRLPAGQGKKTEVTEFEGHCLTTFQLRGRATKLGFVRGDTEDGGSFWLYRKPFPSLEIQAVLEFTGSYLPEEDIPAALTNLYFVGMKSGDDGVSSWNETKLPLKKIPPVLLSECYNDVKHIAAGGTGYDPEWQKKRFW